MWVAEQMGHKEWAMVRHVYGKFMPDAAPNAGDKALEIFDEKSCDSHTKNQLIATNLIHSFRRKFG
jgi:hypothetical protein